MRVRHCLGLFSDLVLRCPRTWDAAGQRICAPGCLVDVWDIAYVLCLFEVQRWVKEEASEVGRLVFMEDGGGVI